MNQELQPMTTGEVLEVTKAQMELVKRTVAKGLTNDEVDLFFYQCKRLGIHPLDKLIHPQKYKNKDGTFSLVFITSIEFMYAKAGMTGAYLGCTKPVWTGNPGEAGCKVEVAAQRLVNGQVAQFWGEAYWDEFCPPPGKDRFWRQFPRRMLPKCAKAQGMREGFAAELRGLYLHEEMEQAQEATYADALTQDFPIATWIPGVLTKVLPSAGTTPMQLFIQTENGTAQLSTFLAPEVCHNLANEPIEYQYGKEGKLRVVTELRVPRQVATQAPVPLPLQATHGEYQQPVTVSSEDIDLYAATVEADTDTDDGEPMPENFFAPDEEVIGTLVGFERRGTANKPHLADVTFSCADGQIDTTCWDDPVTKWNVSFEECLDKKVMFMASVGKVYKGKQGLNLRELYLYTPGMEG